MSNPSHSLSIRPVLRSFGRGLLCRCPSCGTGALFNGYLNQAVACEACGEPLEEYNAGLLVPLAVGLIVVLAYALVFLMIELAGGASPGAYMTILLPLALVASIAVLRPCKGALIGLLWALRASDELAS
ncbi:MAG: DUF983 domain-containing protein [Dehalococcoidia bacterium]|nr:DUF983 domain-containing protein [Dehalococcoidia bacterium]